MQFQDFNAYNFVVCAKASQSLFITQTNPSRRVYVDKEKRLQF